MLYLFKFKKEKFENKQTLRPKIKITLSYKSKMKEIIAILDTGSDLNYIPSDFAEYFELPLSKEIFKAQGAEQEFEYRTSKIYFKLEHPHKSYRKLLEVMVPIKATMHKDIILGTEFLKDFIVELNYKKGTIKLAENPKE